MKNIKKIFSYVVVAALVMALSISCKSNEEPKATGETSSNHPSRGTYTTDFYGNGSSATVIINNDGTCTITGTAKFANTKTQNFNITITKWWYYYDYHNTYYVGSLYEKSEATINSPTTDYFDVSYKTDSGEIYVVFGPEGERYHTGYLKKDN